MQTDAEKKLRAEQNKRFVWHGMPKTEGARCSKRMTKYDVSINEVYINKKTGKLGYSITFRNGIDEFFGKTFEYAILKNRLFFRSGGDGGILIRELGAKNSKYARIRKIEETCELSDFIGSFDMKYDDFYDVYYIEREVD